MSIDGARRDEILETAATMFASSGLRTSLNDIADACGILPGSLYHHFDSKEAIIVELVERYLADLDRVAKEALDALHARGRRPIEDHLVALGEAIAACAIRHRAALLLTLYEPPTAAGDELVQLARRTPTAIHACVRDVLLAGRDRREIRADVDLDGLAERLYRSMLHVGVGVSHRGPGGEQMPALRCRILLHGLAVDMPSTGALDRSDAMRTARQVVSTWAATLDDDRSAHLLAVARAEFGRRGYEATTVRDIAAAAGSSTGSVYRLFGSKDELLAAIMGSFVENVTTAWTAVLHSSSSPLEKLDALIWVSIMVLDRFSEEYRIQLAWLRQSPPSTMDLNAPFAAQLRQMKSLLTAGTRAGELRLVGANADMRARCVVELIWTPETIVRAAGPDGAHSLARDTVLRGAATRSDPDRAR
jgi:AcrR family transcriptional regulator